MDYTFRFMRFKDGKSKAFTLSYDDGVDQDIRFAKILENVSLHPNMFELKQNDSKLRVFSRNIDSVAKAYEVLKKL